MRPCTLSLARTDKRHHLSPGAAEISTMRLLYRATTHGTSLLQQCVPEIQVVRKLVKKERKSKTNSHWHQTSRGFWKLHLPLCLCGALSIFLHNTSFILRSSRARLLLCHNCVFFHSLKGNAVSPCMCAPEAVQKFSHCQALIHRLSFGSSCSVPVVRLRVTHELCLRGGGRTTLLSSSGSKSYSSISKAVVPSVIHETDSSSLLVPKPEAERRSHWNGTD